jgi:predicted KAP-like P-loop ATPase
VTGPEHRDLTIDAPIEEFADDRFARGPFAERIARTIMAQRDPGSLVVGVYGAWGDGKTSVLNLVEKTLAEDSTVVPVRFNPWQLGNEDQVFRGFFALLASALDEKLTSASGRIGKVMKQYGSLLKPIPIAGDAAASLTSGIGGALADGDADLGAQKHKIDGILADSGKRVVILMDDLDRLDKTEIQTVFRLVKVAADFAHTAYVLAFDDAVVSAALADRYATGSIHGVNFLEKIVQLPLHLPPVGQDSLRKLALESVDVALGQAEIELSQAQVNEFVATFQRAVLPRLKTPRVCKRYGNAAMFALPMIGDETSPVDLLLVEAMRIFYPPLYEWVRAHPETVLGSGGYGLGVGGYGHDEARTQLIQGGFEEATGALEPAEKDAAKALLTFLFPRTESAWQNKNWSGDWDRIWATQKRVASADYFDRYFTYAIPLGDISDADVDRLVGLFASETDRDEGIELARELVDRGDEAFVRKLAARRPELVGEIALNAAFVVGLLAADFADAPGVLGLSTMERAALLVTKLLKEVEPRLQVSKALLEATEPLTFALELFRWMNPRPASEEPETDAPTDPFDMTVLGPTMATRIATYWAGDAAIDSLGRRTGMALYFWKTYGEPHAVTSYLSTRLDAEPESTILLIATTLGRAWSMETGVPHEPDVSREGYNTLAEYGIASVIFDRLVATYGDGIGEGDFYSDESMPRDERLAHQFAFIHRKVVGEQAAQSEAASGEDGPERSSDSQD